MRTNAGNLCRLVSPLVALCSSCAFIPGNNFKYLSSEAELCFQSNAGQPGRPRSGGFSEADRFPFTRTAGRGALRRGAPAPLRAAGAAVRLALFGLLGAPGAAPLPVHPCLLYTDLNAVLVLNTACSLQEGSHVPTTSSVHPDGLSTSCVRPHHGALPALLLERPGQDPDQLLGFLFYCCESREQPWK